MKRILMIAAVLSTLATFTLAREPFEKPMGFHALYAGHGDMDDSAFGGGVQITGYESDRASVELAWSYLMDARKKGTRRDMDVHIIALTARYQMPFLKIFGPYAGIGAAYHTFDSSSPLDDDFGWHLCGGLQFEVLDKVVLFGEFRRNTMFSSASREQFDYQMVRAGLNFWF